MAESEHGSEECDGNEMSAQDAPAGHDFRRGTLGGIFILVGPPATALMAQDVCVLSAGFACA